MSNSDFMNVALEAIEAAGRILIENYGRIQVKEKENWHELVTKTDIDANMYILDILKKNFPDHSIVTEEAPKVEKHSEYTWYVDPLDGTTNYTLQIPFVCSAIGLAKNNMPILGVVFNPLTSEIFTGEKGKGAFLNNKPIHVSDNSDIKKTLVNYCHVSKQKDVSLMTKLYPVFKSESRDFRRLASGNLDFCWIACGRNDVYFRTSPILWDVIPGLVIATEAGAKTTDWNNKEWTFESDTLLTTNGKLHYKVMGMIKENLHE
ncbi:MAG: inositol monophosphatase [Candidatus Aenigmarchaeota archaeon]|nr:inositol monophosphatase [Candidatus Aenigmarchaeota archaeon]